MRQTANTPKITLVAFALATLFGGQLHAQTSPALEFGAGSGNPTGNGPSVANQVITLQNNNNNPGGNNFANYNPALTATFSFSNQQYNLPVSQISTGKGLAFGATQNNSSITAPAYGLFPQMNSISSPSNSHFTSTTAVASGTGIDISANRGVGVFVSAKALDNANLSTSGRFYFGDITITFSQTITNPIIHVVGIGGYYQSLGFTTELELQTTGIVLSKLSGSSEFSVSGNKMLNTALRPSSATGSGAASGSVLAAGSGISALTFRVYLRGDGNDNEWSGSGDHQGDVFLIGTSFTAPVNLSGNVYNDGEGLTDNKVDGPGIGNANGSQLYANLLNTGGNVLNTVAVNNDGTYMFNNVASLTTYIVQVSTAQGVKGMPSPVTALIGEWVNTGENLGNGTGSDGSINSRLSVAVGSASVNNANFGIELAPNSDTKWYAIPTPLPNSSMPLIGLGTIPGPLSGLDLEDGLMGSSKKVGITSLPSGGNQLWYNGVQITKGADSINAPSVSNPFIIPSYLLSVLSIKFTGVGSNQTVFNYAFYDAAGVVDGTPASYTINWATVLPIMLVSFTATLNDNHTDLNWTIASENGLSHYVIEKSTDGRNFSSTGMVFASANGADKMNYSFTDNITSDATVIYYRLRSVNHDGRSEVSGTRVIRIAKKSEQITVLTYPNPVSSELRITIPANWQGKKVSYQVFGNNGQVVISKEAGNSSQTETINVSRLTPGFYVVKVACNDEVAQQKIIKQ